MDFKQLTPCIVPFHNGSVVSFQLHRWMSAADLKLVCVEWCVTDWSAIH